MPLTEKGEKILRSMQEEYGAEKGKEVFYASANAGKIAGVHDAAENEVSYYPALKTQLEACADALDGCHARMDACEAAMRDDALRYGQRVPRAVLERLARQGEIEIEGDLPSRPGSAVQIRQGSKRFMVIVE